MEYLFALVGGVSAKLYDDIVDEGFEVSDTIKESLKGIQWITLALISINDFNFTIMNYIKNVLNHLGNSEAYKNPYEFSLLLVYPIFLVLSFHTIQYPNLMYILGFLIFSTGMFIEPFIIVENVSYRKMIIRLIMACLCIGVFILWNSLKISENLFEPYLNLRATPSLLKICLYAGGYFLTSAIVQYYLIKSDVQKDADPIVPA